MTATLAGPGRAATPSPTARPATGRRPVAVVVVAAVVSLAVAVDLQVPVLRAGAGLVLLLVLPTTLLRAKVRWPAETATPERWLVSLGLTLLGLLLGGLLLNTALPPVGVDRPLARWPVLVAADLTVAGLLLWRRSVPAPGLDEVRQGLRAVAGAPGRERVLLTGALPVLLAVVVGAVRLNNGADGGVTLGALIGCALLLLLAITWSDRVRETVVVAVVYAVALALLLMTSLRGWVVVGHDVQREYEVFALTAAAAYWDVGMIRSAYHACLSITILPTLLAEVTAVSGPYVFKVLLQLVAACTPVAVYLLARRFLDVKVALLSVVYFVAFPTFFTDLPFLVRQELAFLFLALLLLAATRPGLTRRRRQAWVLVFGGGVVLSHYSTTYLLVAALAATWVAGGALRALAAARRRRQGHRNGTGLVAEAAVVTPLVVVPLALLTVLWTGPVTHTDGQARQTATAVADALTGRAAAVRSGDTVYSLFLGAPPQPAERLADHTEEAVRESAADRAAGLTYPLAEVERYPTPVVPVADLPLTGLGRALEALGIDVPAVNAALRSGSARLVQVLVLVGLAVVTLGANRGRRVTRETTALAYGSLAVVAAQVLLPAVSVDYGVLRAFQQALVNLAPFLAVGSLAVLAPLGAARARRLATVVALGFFLCLTGVVPQLTGGYPPQLHLNRAGQYYDLYHPQPTELAAARWLERELGPTAVQRGWPGVQTDPYTSLRLLTSSDLQPDEDLHPVQVRRDDYVLLGSTPVRTGTVTVFTGGDLLTYRYPVELLDRHKSVLYASSGARVYR